MIYIPTYKRLDRQPTAKCLRDVGAYFALVVRPEEAEQAVAMGYDIRVLPASVSNIGQTRQWIMDNAEDDAVLMMDDDLAFAVRGKREDNPLYLSNATRDDVRRMITWMYEQLTDKYALVGISAREGNNRKPEATEMNTRMMRCWGIHVPTFKKVGASFETMPCMEDFDVFLTFLTNGYPNLVSNTWTTNQAGSNTDGGCSTYRTLEVQGQAAEALAAKYPGIVKAVEKETKTAWGGGRRKDVTVYWKKAYAKSRLGI
jgi:hypothetical protein